MQYMEATLLVRAKEVRDDGSIVEVVVWTLPEPLPPSTHRFKYRLYSVRVASAASGTTTNAARATIVTSGTRSAGTGSARSNNCSRTSSPMSSAGNHHESHHRGFG
jgi:hypothetical protein